MTTFPKHSQHLKLMLQDKVLGRQEEENWVEGWTLGREASGLILEKILDLDFKCL